MANLKYQPVPHDHPAFLEKAKHDAVVLDRIWIEQLTSAWSQKTGQDNQCWFHQRFVDFRWFLLNKSEKNVPLYIVWMSCFFIEIKGKRDWHGIRCDRGELTCNSRASTVFLAHHGRSAIINFSIL